MRDVPQINLSTGVSEDYLIEYGPKEALLEMGNVAEKMGFQKDRTARLAELIRCYPIKKYEEHFPSSKFLNAVNDGNRNAVSRLDEIAGEANSRFIDPNKFTLDDFRKVVVEVHYLVCGRSTEYNPQF